MFPVSIHCVKCPNCCSRSTCRGKTSPVLGNLGNLGGRTKDHKNTARGLHPSFLDPTKSDKITTIISCYVNPRNLYLLETLHQLMNKNAVKLVKNQESLGFYNRLFLVPKPNNKWRPMVDLCNLNKFLKVEKFKMETPETIRTSFQIGEWVTIDFKDVTFIFPYKTNQESTYVFTSNVKHTNSKHYPLVSPQPPWSSQWWPKTWWHHKRVQGSTST